MMQLCFAFIFAAEAAPPIMSRYRRRLARVAGQAYALGAMRARGKRPVPRAPRPLSAAVPNKDVKPLNAFLPSPVHLDRTDRNELAVLARRVANLSISRRDPEAFFIERDLIYRELLAISRW